MKRNIYVPICESAALRVAAVAILKHLGHQVIEQQVPFDEDGARVSFSDIKKHDAENASMRLADGCLLIAPYGPDACFAAGWFIGKGIPLVVLQLYDYVPMRLSSIAEEAVYIDSMDWFIRHFDIEGVSPFA